ncbi:hypothetical protein ACFVH6_25485 [Spirillospora sp. NPDC127200]
MQHSPTGWPAQWAVYSGTPIALAAVAALSYEPQSALGHAVGWGTAVAWLLPVAVITCELVATVTFFWTEIGPARRSAGRVALAAIAMSYGLSSTWHVLHPGSAPLLVTLAVTAVPNVVAALMLHIAMSISSPVAVEAVEEEQSPDPLPALNVLPPPALPAEVPEPEPAPLPEPRKPSRPRKTSATSSARAQALAALEALPEDASLPSAEELAKQYDRTPRWGRDVLATHRNRNSLTTQAA